MSEKNTHSPTRILVDTPAHESPNEHEESQSPLPMASPASTQTFNHQDTTPLKQTANGNGSPGAHRAATIPHVSPTILRAKTGRFSNTTTLTAAFICGVILALVHHIVLKSLHGHDINEFPQFWVKGVSNAFSTCVAFLLAVATTDALSQIVWSGLRKRGQKMSTIDELFKLPELQAISAFWKWTTPLLFPVLIASIVIRALTVVSILAPNSMIVGQKPSQKMNITVPTVDFSKNAVDNMDSTFNPVPGQYSGPSTYWNESIFALAVSEVGVGWNPPDKCGASCMYWVNYTAPALNCTKSQPEHVDDKTIFYSTSSLFRNGTESSSSSGNATNPPGTSNPSHFDTAGPYNLSLSYFPVKYIKPVGATSYENGSHPAPPGGIFCEFHEGNYQATFNFTGNQRFIVTNLMSYGKVLGGGDAGCPSIDMSGLVGANPPCWVQGVNNRATAEVFSMFFSGTYGWDNNTGITGQIGKQTVFRKLFDLSMQPKNPVYLQPLMENPEKTLMALFSNLTLGLMTIRNDTADVPADVWDGMVVWMYYPETLWSVYAPAILIVLLTCMYGVYCTLKNGFEIDNRFSHFLVATRNIELDKLCQDATTIDGLREHKLHWCQGVFVVADGPYDYSPADEKREDIEANHRVQSPTDDDSKKDIETKQQL